MLIVVLCLVIFNLLVSSKAQLQCGRNLAFFTGTSYTTCTFNSVTFYCASPYGCCDNGCCLNSGYSEIFSEGELAALILGVSALFAIGMLTLMILGATYGTRLDRGKNLFGPSRQ